MGYIIVLLSTNLAVHFQKIKHIIILKCVTKESFKKGYVLKILKKDIYHN